MATTEQKFGSWPNCTGGMSKGNREFRFWVAEFDDCLFFVRDTFVVPALSVVFNTGFQH